MREAVSRHHVRLPDERSRLRADQGHARVARHRRGGTRPRTPTSSSSTPARSARSRTSGSPRTSARPRHASAQNPDVVIAVGGCYAEAQRERIFDRYPFVDVAFGPGSIPHLGDWIGAGGEGVARGRFGTARPLRGRAADASGAALQRVGAGLDGLQLEVRVLHRPRGARPRAEPAAGRDRRRGDAACRATECAR